jgi:hypothetical protein
VAQTTDGGFVAGGWSASNDGDVTGNHGLYDYWVVKTDDGGNLLWQKITSAEMHSIMELSSRPLLMAAQ